MKQYTPLVGSADCKGISSSHRAIVMADRIIVTTPYGSVEINLDTNNIMICQVSEVKDRKGECRD